MSKLLLIFLHYCISFFYMPRRLLKPVSLGPDGADPR